jgi:hypothetical protein
MSGMVLVDMMMIWGFVMLEMLFVVSLVAGRGGSHFGFVSTLVTDWVFSLVKD